MIIIGKVAVELWAQLFVSGNMPLAHIQPLGQSVLVEASNWTLINTSNRGYQILEDLQHRLDLFFAIPWPIPH